MLQINSLNYEIFLDLTRYMDQLVSSVLFKGNKELVEDLTRMITVHNFSLRKTTYQGLISFLVRTDELLAKQLYQYSTGFNVYGTFKVKSIISVGIFFRCMK